jgi:hypothetical protein
LSQGLEPASGGDDFGALVGALADEFSDGSAVTTLIEYCGRSRAGLSLSVSEAGAVDGDRDLFVVVHFKCLAKMGSGECVEVTVRRVGGGGPAAHYRLVVE